MSQTKAELIDPKGDVAFDTNTFYVDATNNRVGVGSNAPSYLLDLLGSAPRIRVKDSSTGAAFHHFENNSGNFYLGIDNSTGGSLSAGNYARVLWSQGAYPLVFATNDTQRAQIDSSGRLLVGTSSARDKFNNSASGQDPLVQFEAAGTAAKELYMLSLTANNNSTSSNAGVSLMLARSNGTTLNSYDLVPSGNCIGQIRFQAADGSELVEAANISAFVDGTSGANDMPGRLVFSTTADGASSPTEWMRLTNAGQLRIGSRIDLNPDQDLGGSGNNRSVGFFNGTGGSIIASNAFNQTGTITHINFYNGNGAVGSITTNGSATAYNTSSDFRLKENVVAVTDGITRLQKLKPSRFNFIADPAKTVDGFIAHEVQAIVPEAITGEKDAVNDDGTPIYQGIDQSKLVPLLTAALQEAVAKIESLEARLTAAGI